MLEEVWVRKGNGTKLKGSRWVKVPPVGRSTTLEVESLVTVVLAASPIQNPNKYAKIFWGKKSEEGF